jgi:hypothetical protein
MADSIREELQSRWRALIDGEITRERAIEWAQRQLTNETWTDEVTHAGLQLLNDRVHEDWSIVDAANRQDLLSIYGRWMDDVRSFDEEPVSWKRTYAVRFVRELPAPMQVRAIDTFRAAGYLRDEDLGEFRLSGR